MDMNLSVMPIAAYYEFHFFHINFLSNDTNFMLS